MSKEQMYDNKQRTNYFKKDMSLEDALFDINKLIEPLAEDILKIPEKPILLIMGCARSGSTLLMQYLSSLGIFSYPSNLIARFYKNPYVGIRVQQALLEFDPMNQLKFNIVDHGSYDSNLGKTMGAVGPSEYWYFWREYFKFSTYNYLTDKDLALVDYQLFLKKLSSFEYLTSKPLVMKGMMLNWNIPYLYSIYPKFIFINLKRDIIANSHSLLNARKTYFNDVSKWYSFKPLEYEELMDKNPIGQVVGQVFYTQRAVENGLTKIPLTNKIDITYENFCRNPNELLNMIQIKFKELGFNYNFPINDQTQFTVSKKNRISEKEMADYKEALSQYV